MPDVIISFDMNTKGSRSTEARQAFEDALATAGWSKEILVGDRWETLPDTTLVATRTAIQAKGDAAAAEAAAKRVEPLFAVTKFVISKYDRIDSRSNDTRPGQSFQERVDALMKNVGLR